MSDWTIGIIGGSGLYAIDALEDAQWIPVQSPWGAPSDEILCGTIGHVRVRFLPRHGRGHRLAPSTLDARANIDALKRAAAVHPHMGHLEQRIRQLNRALGEPI